MEKIVNENVTEFLFEQEKEQSFLFEQTEEPKIRFDGEKPIELYRSPPVKGALLDGEQVPIDKDKNLILEVGIKKINDRLAELEAASATIVPFVEEEFVLIGQKYTLKIPISVHKKGYKASVVAVKAILDNGSVEDITYQSHITLSGQIIVELTTTLTRGCVYIIGGK